MEAGTTQRKAKTDQHSQQVWEEFWQKQAIENVYSNADRITRQIQQLGDCRGKIIMEIGAGSGRDGFQLVDLGATVIFLDYAESSLRLIEQLSQKLKKPVHLVRGDAFHLPFKENSIDVVYHQGLLEHFTDPSGIVRENYAVVKPGGVAIADVPQKYHFYTVVKHILIWMNKWFAGWETEFSIHQLKHLYRSAGFQIQSVYGDWMRPSFLYRAAREALKKIKITLPQYPKRIPGISNIRDAWRRFFMQRKLAFYTFMDIGVIARKKDH